MKNLHIKQNDIVILDIVDYGINGEGIAKSEGVVIFVPLAMKGEKVKAKITFVKKSFATANLVEVIKSSPKRIDPPCNRFSRCGGCNLLHIDYDEQLTLKTEMLKTTLRKNTGKDFDVSECRPSNTVYAYRNKVQLPFGIVNGKVAVGFFQENSHKVVSITKCFLHESWLEKLVGIILNFANSNSLSVYDETSGKGLLRHLVARYIDSKLSITLVINGDKIPNQNELVRLLQQEFNDFSLYLSENRENTNVIMGKKLITIVEKEFAINILGINVLVSPLSFLQVNNFVRDAIYTKVISELSHSDIIIDAFSGVGIMGALLAKNGVKKVYNIEIIPEAIHDANLLAESNNLSPQIENLCGDAAELLPQLINDITVAHKADNDNPKPKIGIILDPPRKGVDRAIIEALNDIDYPITLVYISCNPATLSRDLALLTKGDNYVINSITPYDMFPQTRHLETLVCLSRKV